jgi:hypothetical protein
LVPPLVQLVGLPVVALVVEEVLEAEALPVIQKE